MSSRFVSLICCLMIVVAAAAYASSDATPVPPAQPADGPGGKTTAASLVIKHRYGEGASEYWIFEPDGPEPASAPLIIFVHGWGATNPLYYGAWIDHIVRRGNIVVYPRYQTRLRTPPAAFIPAAIASVKDAIGRLQNEPGHVRPALDKFGVVGHSAGGLIAASLAARAAQSGLPRVGAIMSIEPALTRDPVDFPLADLSTIAGDTLLLAVAGDQDLIAGDSDAKRVFYESTKVPLSNKDFIKVVSDDHGVPTLNASHGAPTAPDSAYDNGEVTSLKMSDARREAIRQRLSGRFNLSLSDQKEPRVTDALDFYGYWKLWDALCDAAFYGRNREYALGNTPQQRFMGVWSDGIPVKQLLVTDKP